MQIRVGVGSDARLEDGDVTPWMLARESPGRRGLGPRVRRWAGLAAVVRVLQQIAENFEALPDDLLQQLLATLEMAIWRRGTDARWAGGFGLGKAKRSFLNLQ